MNVYLYQDNGITILIAATSDYQADRIADLYACCLEQDFDISNSTQLPVFTDADEPKVIWTSL